MTKTFTYTGLMLMIGLFAVFYISKVKPIDVGDMNLNIELHPSQSVDPPTFTNNDGFSTRRSYERCPGHPLEHIKCRHGHNSTERKVSKFFDKLSERKQLRKLAKTARKGVSNWKQSGKQFVGHFRFNKEIGTLQNGKVTQWVRIVLDKTGGIRTMFPVKAPF